MSVRFRWRTYLRSATTEQAVVDLVRVYLESWSPEEIARLPAAAKPGPMASGRDVVRETLRIGQAHSNFAGNRASLALVQELLLFMTQASVRATQLAPLPGEAESPQQPADARPGDFQSMQRPVGGKVLSEEEKQLFEAPPVAQKPVKDAE